MDRVSHWQNIYSTKRFEEVSWYQLIPYTSIELIKSVANNLDVSIIDIGGGDSYLVDHLISSGYRDVTVLDISGNALQRVKRRIGETEVKVNWIETDIVDFVPNRQYDIWHDRAALHFLTEDKDASAYAAIAKRAIKAGGYLIIGVFSNEGPDKCSGVFIRKYDIDSLKILFKDGFELTDGFTMNHTTPSGGNQTFVFSVFRKMIS